MEDYDLTIMHVADPVTGEQLGQEVLTVHPLSACEGRDIPCCIHSPSDHHMRTWDMNWRADTRVMERICPHGIGHPDPDHMAYVRSLTPDSHTICPGPTLCKYPHLSWQGIHSCDGCCYAP